MIAAGDTRRIGNAFTLTPIRIDQLREEEVKDLFLYGIPPPKQPTGMERTFERWRIRFARFAPSLFGFIPINFNQRQLSAYYSGYLPIASRGGAHVYLKRKDNYREIVIAGRFYDLASFMDKLFRTKHFSLGYRAASIRATKTDSDITDESLFIPGTKEKITTLNHYNETTGIHEVTLLIDSPDPAPIYDLLLKKLKATVESFNGLSEYEIELPVGVYSNPLSKLREMLDFVHSNEAQDVKALLNEEAMLRSIGIEKSDRENFVSVGLRLSAEGRIQAITIRVIENIVRKVRDGAGAPAGSNKKFLNQSLWVGHLVDRGSAIPEMIWEVIDSDLQDDAKEKHMLHLARQIQNLFIGDVNHLFLLDNPSTASPTATPSATPAPQAPPAPSTPAAPSGGSAVSAPANIDGFVDADRLNDVQTDEIAGFWNGPTETAVATSLAFSDLTYVNQLSTGAFNYTATLPIMAANPFAMMPAFTVGQAAAL